MNEQKYHVGRTEKYKEKLPLKHPLEYRIIKYFTDCILMISPPLCPELESVHLN